MHSSGIDHHYPKIDLVECNPLAPMGHEQPVANFIEPQDWNCGAFVGETCEHGETIFAVGLVFQKPLERQRRVQNQITHRR